MKVELDVWYELWDGAGAAGLDTWRELSGPEGPAREGDPAASSGTEGMDGPVGAGPDALNSCWEGG